MTPTVPHVAISVAVLAFCSCSAPDEPNVCAETSAIVNGVTEPPAQLGQAAFSVVGLRVRHGVGERAFDEVCSGVRIDDRQIVTAAHCFSDDPEKELTITLATSDVLSEDNGCGASAAPVTTDPLVPRLHPQRDVAVVTTPPTFASAVPVCSSPPELGTAGYLAGYGLDETGGLGARRFLYTHVANVTDDAIEVRSPTEAGACVGDSGGPFFIEQAGAWCVAGTLSTGSASCRAFDRYVPLLPLADWLQRH